MLALIDVDRFFSELDKKIDFSVKILITGAVAGAIMGHLRASEDIDFEIALPKEASHKHLIEKVESAVREVCLAVKIPAQYSESIQGWSQISLLNYREEALAYKTIGKIELLYLAPEHWSIGKLVRYLPLDKKDILNVFKKRGVKKEGIIKTWAHALESSPLSDRSREFKNHAVDFFKTEGKNVWGNNFSHEEAIAEFKRIADIA